MSECFGVSNVFPAAISARGDRAGDLGLFSSTPEKAHVWNDRHCAVLQTKSHGVGLTLVCVVVGE